MRKTFKYRIYGNKQAVDNLDYQLYLCRRLYNTALQQKIMLYKQNRHVISCNEQKRQLTELKKDFPEYKQISSHVLQDVLERLERSYGHFFRRYKNSKGKFGFPRFKSRNRYHSLTFKKGAGWKLEGKYLHLSKIGTFKIKLSRLIEGDIKTVIVTRKPSGKFYACFNCDNVPERKLDKTGNAIGIDVGIHTFSVDSVGVRFENQHYFDNSMKLMHRRHRKLSRRKIGSNRRNKARLLLTKVHEKIANQRNDFLHKISNYYVKNYDYIFVEALNVSGMTRTPHLGKPILDCAWGKFFDLLEYKAEEAEHQLIKITPHGTSQICSGCGAKVHKNLKQRVHICPYCGLILDRDENAAINHLNLGLIQVGHTYQTLTSALVGVV